MTVIEEEFAGAQRALSAGVRHPRSLSFHGSEGPERFVLAHLADCGNVRPVPLPVVSVEPGIDAEPPPSTFYGAPIGISAAASTPTALETLSPGEATTASRLAVRFTLSPCQDALRPGGCETPGAAAVTLEINGQDSLLSCTITYPATTCDSGSIAVPVPAASRLSIKVSGDLIGVRGDPIYNRDALFSFQVNPL